MQQQQQRQQPHSCYQQQQQSHQHNKQQQQQQQPDNKIQQGDTSGSGGDLIGGKKHHSTKKSSNNNHHQHHHQHQQQQQQHHHQIENFQNNNNYYYSKSVESISGGGNNNNNNNNNNTTTTYGQESWGRDSGARDLSPEPPEEQHHLLLPSSAAISSGTDSQLTDHPDVDDPDDIQQSSMMHLTTKLQVAALSALKTEVIDVSSKLQQSERERDHMERQLKEALDERDRAQRRLEAIGTAHESRITEMHCVIVELSKKLKNQKETAIVEENYIEGSVSELSFQDGSVYNSEMECTNIESQHNTEPTFDIKLKNVSQSMEKEEEQKKKQRQLSGSPCSLPPPIVTSTQLQLQAMHEEIFHLRSQVAYLQSQIPPQSQSQSPQSDEINQKDFINNKISSSVTYQMLPPETHKIPEQDLNELCNRFDNDLKITTTTTTTTATINQSSNYLSYQPPFGNDYNLIIDDLQEQEKNYCFNRRQHSIAKQIKINQMALPALRGVSATVQLYGGGNHSLKKSSPQNYNNQLYMENGNSHHQQQQQQQQQHQQHQHHQPIVSKMAERVKLRRTIEEENHITGAEIMNCGIYTTEIAEHLVSDLLQNEMIDECPANGGDGGDGGDCNNTTITANGDSSYRLRFQSEIQRLLRRIDHLRIQNSVLQITLQEAKAHCDHLYLLCGKYESNAIALHQALNYSDRAIEAYDVMLALLESRLNLVENEQLDIESLQSWSSSPSPSATATATAAVDGTTTSPIRITKSESTFTATDSRRAAEAVARHLMDRLESENILHYNSSSLGPWQDAIVVLYENNKNNTDPWTSTDDLRLRGHVSKLKGLRAAVQNTVVILESPFVETEQQRFEDEQQQQVAADDDEQTNERYHSNGKPNINKSNDYKKQPNNNRRMDLEMAVLMQELMGMREDVCEFKFRTEQAEYEKNSALKRLSVFQVAIMHLQTQLIDSEKLLAISNSNNNNNNNKDRSTSTYSESEHTAGIERELVEALARESRLKARLQGLVASLETAAKSSEEKYAQVQKTVSELKRANLTLTQSLGHYKRKYANEKRKVIKSELAR